MGNKVLWTLGIVAGALLLAMGGIEYWRWSVDRELPINDTNLRAWRFFGLLHKYVACKDRDDNRPRSDAEIVEVSLRGTEVTDAGLKDLARLTNLTTLVLEVTQVTDAGLKDLARLTNLTTLDLRGTQVTDAGLQDLLTPALET